MAINIPYRAIPRALEIMGGSTEVATAPTRVPPDQPSTGVAISPAM